MSYLAEAYEKERDSARATIAEKDKALTAERRRREECEKALRPFADWPTDPVFGKPSDLRFRAAHEYFSHYPSESDNRTKVAG